MIVRLDTGMRLAGPSLALGLTLALAMAPQSAGAASAITVATGATGIVITTPTARFTFDKAGRTAAALRRGALWVTLDDAGLPSSEQLLLGDKPLAPAVFDTAGARVSETFGPLGATGQAVTVVGR